MESKVQLFRAKHLMNLYFELDELFFEGLGLWQAEGSKDKGLYFTNSSLDLLLHFLKFCEEKIGFDREYFKVCIFVPSISKQ